ncbi:hypothetical protein J7315_12415 [Providencia rettgeri]|uniref:hypothetical protein n=1 Tax=Providencia rettgeri TaxID=587 RepID=UPI001B362FBF|nr:hypothetical protein [Providencia rettgeri]MBQ0686869.1 hypothetical protein [Providencia rettgeri]
MEFNFSDIWGTLKSPSLGFVIFIMLCIFLFKIKDIIDVLEILKTRKINNLKMLRDELISTRGVNSCEKKLLDNIIEMEMLKLSLGVSNKEVLPLFSYLATKINFQTLLITKKCIDYIDLENFCIDTKSVSKRFWSIVFVCIAIIIYIILTLINELTGKIEIQWLLISAGIFTIVGAFGASRKLPATTEIQRMNEVLGNIDKDDYLKYKNEFMNISK